MILAVTHKGLIGDEFIGGKAVMKLNNIHVFCSHTWSMIFMHDNYILVYKTHSYSYLQFHNEFLCISLPAWLKAS